jgi:hypothetical protein
MSPYHTPLVEFVLFITHLVPFLILHSNGTYVLIIITIELYYHLHIYNYLYSRGIWRYHMGNQNPYIEEEQTTQWPKEKVQKDKQRSTKHTYKTKDRVTRTPLKTGCELRCSGRVGSSCFTSGTRRVNLVTNPVISREWGKDQKVLTTSGTYPLSFVTQIFHSGQPSHGDDFYFTKSSPWFSSFNCLVNAGSLSPLSKMDWIITSKTESCLQVVNINIMLKKWKGSIKDNVLRAFGLQYDHRKDPLL